MKYSLSANQLKNKLIITLILAMTLLSTVGIAQDSLVDGINKMLIPLTTLNPEGDFSDLEPLKEILREKKIIGLGEATHGTSEFFSYKHRLIKYMVTELGYRTFVIEADFAGSEIMNDYITNGVGTIDSAVRAMSVGIWHTQEFFDLVEWMKAYNQDKSKEDQLRFYGCDIMVAWILGGKFRDGEIPMEKPFSDKAKEGLDLINKTGFQNLSKEQLALMNYTAEELRNNKPTETDPKILSLHKQYVNLVLKMVEFKSESKLYLSDIIRDQYMAENCEWIYNYEEGRKMIIWSHNAHIAKDILPLNRTNLPMGGHLAKKFPSEYYALAFGFNSGAMREYSFSLGKNVSTPIPEFSVKNSSDYIFSLSNEPNFILDFKTASENKEIAHFLNQKTSTRIIGAQYNPKEQAVKKGVLQKLVNLYDGIVFIRSTTASKDVAQ